MTTQTPNPWMTTVEVAAELGVDVKTVRRWADAGKFGAQKRHHPGPRGRGYLEIRARKVASVKADLEADRAAKAVS
jgi:excisionase family DNA binding protein